MQIAVVCESGSIDPRDLAFIVAAWDAQSREFCVAWNIPYVPVVLYKDLPQDQVGIGELRVLTIEDTLDVPSAEGYHTDDLGIVFARVLTENNADAGSHECCEESLDPTCDVWKPMGNGSSVAYEAADPVEGDSYEQTVTIGDDTRQIPVTNFVLPSWFDPNGKAPFDRMGKLTAPFTMTPGGYMVVQNAEGNTTDVFDKLGGSSPTSWPPGALTDDRYHAGTVTERGPDGSIKEVVHGGPRIVGDEAGRARAEKKRQRPDSRVARRLAVKPRAAAPSASPGHAPSFG